MSASSALSTHLRSVGPTFLSIVVLLTLPSTGVAQQNGVVRGEANPEDVESVEALLTALYDAISAGPDGKERDWDRYRSLFLPEAQMTYAHRSEGQARYAVMTVEDYIEVANARYANEGLFARQIDATEERFGDIAHVLSTYEVRRSPDEEPYLRGINSFQLWHDGDRWWIASLLWQNEYEGVTIPTR